MNMEKALPINVYRTNRLSDCTNSGISSKYDELLLLCDEGFIDVDLDNPPENLVIINVFDFRGEVYDHIEPFVRPNDGCVGWMNGGNIAFTSDSRFDCEYPLCIHDRQETQAEYDMLSR